MSFVDSAYITLGSFSWLGFKMVMHICAAAVPCQFIFLPYLSIHLGCLLFLSGILLNRMVLCGGLFKGNAQLCGGCSLPLIRYHSTITRWTIEGGNALK